MFDFNDLARGGTAPTASGQDSKANKRHASPYRSHGMAERPKTRAADNDMSDFNMSLRHNNAANKGANRHHQEHFRGNKKDSIDANNATEPDEDEYLKAIESFQDAIDSWSTMQTTQRGGGGSAADSDFVSNKPSTGSHPPPSLIESSAHLSSHTNSATNSPQRRPESRNRSKDPRKQAVLSAYTQNVPAILLQTSRNSGNNSNVSSSKASGATGRPVASSGYTHGTQSSQNQHHGDVGASSKAAVGSSSTSSPRSKNTNLLELRQAYCSDFNAGNTAVASSSPSHSSTGSGGGFSNPPLAATSSKDRSATGGSSRPSSVGRHKNSNRSAAVGTLASTAMSQQGVTDAVVAATRQKKGPSPTNSTPYSGGGELGSKEERASSAPRTRSSSSRNSANPASSNNSVGVDGGNIGSSTDTRNKHRSLGGGNKSNSTLLKTSFESSSPGKYRETGGRTGGEYSIQQALFSSGIPDTFSVSSVSTIESGVVDSGSATAQHSETNSEVEGGYGSNKRRSSASRVASAENAKRKDRLLATRQVRAEFGDDRETLHHNHTAVNSHGSSPAGDGNVSFVPSKKSGNSSTTNSNLSKVMVGDASSHSVSPPLMTGGSSGGLGLGLTLNRSNHHSIVSAADRLSPSSPDYYDDALSIQDTAEELLGSSFDDAVMQQMLLDQQQGQRTRDVDTEGGHVLVRPQSRKPYLEMASSGTVGEATGGGSGSNAGTSSAASLGSVGRVRGARSAGAIRSSPTASAGAMQGSNTKGGKGGGLLSPNTQNSVFFSTDGDDSDNHNHQPDGSTTEGFGKDVSNLNSAGNLRRMVSFNGFHSSSAAQLWNSEDHNAFQRPPSRQSSAFPVHLSDPGSREGKVSTGGGSSMMEGNGKEPNSSGLSSSSSAGGGGSGSSFSNSANLRNSRSNLASRAGHREGSDNEVVHSNALGGDNSSSTTGGGGLHISNLIHQPSNPSGATDSGPTSTGRSSRARKNTDSYLNNPLKDDGFSVLGPLEAPAPFTITINYGNHPSAAEPPRRGSAPGLLPSTHQSSSNFNYQHHSSHPHDEHPSTASRTRGYSGDHIMDNNNAPSSVSNNSSGSGVSYSRSNPTMLRPFTTTNTPIGSMLMDGGGMTGGDGGGEDYNPNHHLRSLSANGTKIHSTGNASRVTLTSLVGMPMVAPPVGSKASSSGGGAGGGKGSGGGGPPSSHRTVTAAWSSNGGSASSSVGNNGSTSNASSMMPPNNMGKYLGPAANNNLMYINREGSMSPSSLMMQKMQISQHSSSPSQYSDARDYNYDDGDDDENTIMTEDSGNHNDTLVHSYTLETSLGEDFLSLFAQGR